jgi:hypothetical protein
MNIEKPNRGYGGTELERLAARKAEMAITAIWTVIFHMELFTPGNPGQDSMASDS